MPELVGTVDAMACNIMNKRVPRIMPPPSSFRSSLPPSACDGPAKWSAILLNHVFWHICSIVYLLDNDNSHSTHMLVIKIFNDCSFKLIFSSSLWVVYAQLVWFCYSLHWWRSIFQVKEGRNQTKIPSNLECRQQSQWGRFSPPIWQWVQVCSEVGLEWLEFPFLPSFLCMMMTGYEEWWFPVYSLAVHKNDYRNSSDCGMGERD